MMKVEFNYLEVINETEQWMIFTVTLGEKDYGLDLMLNTALPIEVQDNKIRRIVERLSKLTLADVPK